VVSNKKLIEEAQSAKASAITGQDGTRAARQRGANREIAVLLDRIAEVQVNSEGSISKPTALLVDRSSAEAHEMGRRLARLISAALIDRVARLHVFAFDSPAQSLNATGGSSAGLPEVSNNVDTPFQPDPVGALELLRKNRVAVEQIVVLVGAGGAEASGLAGAYAAYKRDLGLAPAVLIVNASGMRESAAERELHRAGAPIIAHSFNGDRNTLVRLIPLLCRPSKLELIMGILESGAARGSH